MNKISIGVVDNDTMIRDAFVNSLNAIEEFEVVLEAGCGIRLAELIEARRIVPEILLLDIEMRGMNGYKTAEMVKMRWPSMKIIVISAHTTEYAVKEMLWNGAMGFLSKDDRFDDVIDLIREVSRTNKVFQNVHLTGSRLKSVQTANKRQFAEKEVQVLEYIMLGYTLEECAKRIHLSKRTVEKYRDRLYQKTQTHNRQELVEFGRINGFKEG